MSGDRSITFNELDQPVVVVLFGVHMISLNGTKTENAMFGRFVERIDS